MEEIVEWNFKIDSLVNMKDIENKIRIGNCLYVLVECGL